MMTIYYPPHRALVEYVDMICMIDHDFFLDDELSPIYTYMPTHTRFLCFYLKDKFKVKRKDRDFEEKARSVIIGPQTAPVALDLGEKHSCIIVILKPCGLYRLIGIPLKEIVDCDFDASLVIGKEITELTERLINLECNEEKNTVIQNYLLGKLDQLKPALPIDFAMLQLRKSHGQLSMDFLASKACLSIRQLERKSLDRIGLPPKYFAKMIRFSEAYKFKERNPKATWTEITYRFGYYDQTHLARDFHHFTGINPSMMKVEEILHTAKLNSMDL